MPTLVTQSIGVVGAQISGHQHGAAQARATEASNQAGVQRAQNEARAINSATKVQTDAQRSIQQEKRAEGTFAETSDDGESEQQPDKPGSSKSGGRFTRVA